MYSGCVQTGLHMFSDLQSCAPHAANVSVFHTLVILANIMHILL